MKIIELQAENVKRLRAVEIRPDGTLQVIGGRNAQGKSSVLDAIWLALGGGKAAKETTLPIREGESKASVRLDLGDLVITRSWTRKGTSLKVTNAEGASYSSPQSMLDALVGRLSFDPLEFTRLSAKDQREALLGLVDLGIDLDELARQRNEIFAERSEVGRRGKAIGDVQVDESLPAEETSASEIIGKIREAQEENGVVQAQKARMSVVNARVKELAETIAQLQREAALYKDEELAIARFLEENDETDTAPLEAQLAMVEETNAKIRANNQARKQAEHKLSLIHI